MRPGNWSQLGQGIEVFDSFGTKVTTDFDTVAIYNTVTIENAIGSDFADIIYGNNVNNQLDGGNGDDQIDGGEGADVLNGEYGKDTLTGGAGDDTYFIDNKGDIIVETSLSDHDSVESSISYSLGKNLGDLTLDGSANLNGSGNELNNVILGNDGNNILDGKAGDDFLNGGVGKDTLIGGDGDDTYIVDKKGDKVIELPLSGIDTIHSNISYTLGKNVENLFFDGSANSNGIGNSLDNALLGNDGNNILDGKAGDDIILGGNGNDRLTGGKGADIFVFNSTPSPENIDTITDFSKGLDKIFLGSAIFGAYSGGADFLSVRKISSATFGAKLIFETSTHSLFYDNDGSGSNNAQLFIKLIGSAYLRASDVALVDLA